MEGRTGNATRFPSHLGVGRGVRDCILSLGNSVSTKNREWQVGWPVLRLVQRGPFILKAAEAGRFHAAEG